MNTPDPAPVVDLTPDASPFECADRLALLVRMEREIRERRIAAESRLITALDFPASLNRPDAKSRTYKIFDDQSSADITVTLELRETVKLEPSDLAAIRDRIPPDLLPVRIKEEVDARAFTKLKAHYPEYASIFSRAVVRTPGKTGVSFPS